MTEIINKYIKKEELDAFFQDNNYNKDITDEFIRFLDQYLTDLESDNALEEDNFAFKTSVEYIQFYALKKNEGFSDAWSRKFANLKTDGESTDLFSACYSESVKENPELTDQDVSLFCTKNNRDQMYYKQLTKLIKLGQVHSSPPIEQQVSNYCKLYKDQLKKGKSELYADKVADLVADDSSSLGYGEDYAFAYEKALNEGKDEQYTNVFANKYADELLSVKS